MKVFRTWARRAYSLRTRGITLGILGLVFLGVLPFLLVRSGVRLDARLHLPPLRHRTANRVAGAVLVAAGAAFALPSIRAQVDLGSGTPLPVMPTQRLVVAPPFSWCRNPMTLGTILAYSGVALAAATKSGLGLVALGAAALLAYIRFVEEKELADRFGDAYLEYKRTTPFLFPRPGHHRVASPGRGESAQA